MKLKPSLLYLVVNKESDEIKKSFVRKKTKKLMGAKPLVLALPEAASFSPTLCAKQVIIELKSKENTLGTQSRL